MARELGVDINDVAGSGSGGRISADDVKAHVSRLVSGGAGTGAAPAEPLPDFSRWGEIERQPMRGVRRKTAQHLAAAWASIPHVTQHELADITALDELRKRYAKAVEAAGGSLTVTAILVKVVAAALRRFPQVNSSVDMAAEEIVYKKYVHIGIAVDTDHGLLVPVHPRCRHEERDPDFGRARAVVGEGARPEAVARGDAGRLLQPVESRRHRRHGVHADRQRAGSGDPRRIAARALEPVLPRSRELVPRLMLPLSLSYDHRVVDGAEGIRFLRWVVEALEQPFLLVLQG